MKTVIQKYYTKILRRFNRDLEKHASVPYIEIYYLFKEYTMIPQKTYLNNLLLANNFKDVDGSVVECGTWRGGMIGGIAKLFSDNRNYYLFDSFKGLPRAQSIDGESALQWQNTKDAPGYHDNCKADITFAEKAMKLSDVKNVHIHKGWFSETLPIFSAKEKIAILRLDADWYDSTTECLFYLYDHVVDGGIIIFDDYYAWDGCARAVHDFLSGRKLSDKIRQWKNDNVCYIIKEGKEYQLDRK